VKFSKTWKELVLATVIVVVVSAMCPVNSEVIQLVIWAGVDNM